MDDENSSLSEEEAVDDLFEQPRFDVDQISDFIHNHDISSMTVEYEEVIASCGYGWFQRVLLLVCGWAFVSDSIEIQVILLCGRR